MSAPHPDPELQADLVRIGQELHRLAEGRFAARGHEADPAPGRYGGRHGPLTKLLLRQRVRGKSAHEGSAAVTVRSGPFGGLASVRAFERALAELPHVREVVLLGFEGSDRAVFDVRLEERTS